MRTRRTVEAHGGQIASGGAAFAITFPRESSGA
jgi:hypothetical protein